MVESCTYSVKLPILRYYYISFFNIQTLEKLFTSPSLPENLFTDSLFLYKKLKKYVVPTSVEENCTFFF